MSTYKETANDFSLWMDYVDPMATMTEAEFDAMTETEKIQLQVDCFGEEVE